MASSSVHSIRKTKPGSRFIKSHPMKKLYPFFLIMLCMAGAVALSSCSDDDSSSSGDPDMPESGNALICNGVVREIKSAVYTVETPGNGEKADVPEAAPVYTIYLSPTAGLVDADGMLIADDAVKITVKQPSGAVDLTAAGNGIVYGEIDVNSSNVGEASKAALSVEFLSARVARISAEIETGGKTLTVAYYGPCKNSDASEEGDDADKVVLDKVPLSWYLGPVKGVESHNYYMAFTDAEYTVAKGQVTLKEAGYLFVADLYAVPGEDAYTLPEGEYMASQLNEDHTFTSQYTGVQYIDAEGNKTQLSLVPGEPLKVTREGDVWSVSLRFVDTDGSEKSIVYEGQLQIVDQPEDGGFYLPQIGRDVEVVGFSATATYYGNMLEAGTGMMQINIYDETYDTEKGQGGLAAALVVFNDLFGNPKEAVIKPHEYLANTSFQWGSWMPAVEIPMEAMVFPLGTYVQLDDGTSFGQFSYGKEGTIKIEAVGESKGENGEGESQPVYKIEFNLTSKDGFTLKGSYTGVIPITDASDDKPGDDGTSTLERDYDMDLSKIKKAHYYTSDQIYIQGIGYKPVSTYNCGLQFINIGIESVGDRLEDFVDREPGGDIVRLELATEPGKENEITPGTYEVTEQRWPEFIKPGVMMRGIMLNGALSGSRWMHQSYSMWGDDDKIFEYMDAHALLYGGQVTITKVEGEGKENWYRFEVDGICVRKHHVRGTWEGPVVSQTAGGAAAEKDHLEPPRLLRRLPAPKVSMSRLAEKLPDVMFRKAGMTE